MSAVVQTLRTRPAGAGSAVGQAVVTAHADVAAAGIAATDVAAAIPAGAGWRRQLVTGLVVGDLLAAATAALVAGRLGLGGSAAELVAGRLAIPPGVVALVMVATWPLVLAAHEAYALRPVGGPLPAGRRVFDAGLSALVALAVAHLLVGTSAGPRYAALLVGSAVGLSLSGRVAAGWLVDWQRHQGRWLHRVVLHGPAEETADLARRLQERPGAGLAVAAVVAERHDGERHDDGRQVLDTVQRVGADLLAVAGDVAPARLRQLARGLDGSGVELLAPPPAGEAPGGPGPALGTDIVLRPIEGVPLVQVEPLRPGGPGPVVKAVGERLVAAAMLVALSPLLLVTTVLVRGTSPGPVLFRQPRIGRHGRPFTIVKFRTMVPDAEARQQALLDQNQTDGLLFKIPEDPRITPVGRLLRRTSIDELPQLWNVVRGDMALIGPRPLPVPPEGFSLEERRRHAVRPGITGLSQISGRSDLSWRDTIGLDLDYVDHWSLGLDLSILLRTPAVVVGAHGAY